MELPAFSDSHEQTSKFPPFNRYSPDWPATYVASAITENSSEPEQVSRAWFCLTFFRQVAQTQENKQAYTLLDHHKNMPTKALRNDTTGPPDDGRPDPSLVPVPICCRLLPLGGLKT